MTSYRLAPEDRAEALRRLGTEQLDVLVVGGGVVGAGSALDAATRGLSVGLLERADWAAGTSSRSSRLAHGGLRYLEQLEFGLVREALAERGLLLERLAPHLVRPVPFLLPLTRGWERPYLGAGVALYDALSRVSTRGRSIPRPPPRSSLSARDRSAPRRGATLNRHRHLSRTSVERLAPGLDPSVLTGAIGFYDAQIDDARHTLAAVRTAASRGAVVASRVEVVGLLRDEGGAVRGVQAVDRETGARLSVRARVVLTALGVWTDAVDRWAGGAAPDAEPAVVPSIGVHLVLPGDAIDSRTAVIARTPQSVLFLLPWHGQWLVGTTDTPWTGDRDQPRPTEADVSYLLDQANRWLRRPLVRADVVGVYAGLRPLVAPPAGDDDGETTRLSREHAVTRPLPGLVSVTGGKYTTYRVMAVDAVDEVVRVLDVPVPPSRTEHVPLAGAVGYREAWAARAETAAAAGVPEAVLAHLLRRHGTLADDVLELVAADPGLGRRLHPEAPYLAAEVVVAAAREGALHLDDVLVRRTRLALETRDGARSVAADAARLMAPVLGWDAARSAEEVSTYLADDHGGLA